MTEIILAEGLITEDKEIPATFNIAGITGFDLDMIINAHKGKQVILKLEVKDE